MPSSMRMNSASADRLSGREIIILALIVSFPVIGLDQFLRTSSGRFYAQPYVQVGHWIADALVVLPLFVIGIWAGDWVASLAGLRTARRADVLKRALLITLLAALAQVPAWFVVNRTDNPMTAQPIVFPLAHDSGDVYWVAPWVVITLVCVCLAPVAVWAARAIGRTITGRVAAGDRGTGQPRRRAAAVTRGSLLVLLLAGAAVLAVVLHQAAERAYASQVYYSPTSAVTDHSHVLAARHARPPASSAVTAAPFAFVYQAAHALQDGLAGQAAGLPAAAIALLWVTRGRNSTKQHDPADPQGGVE